MTNRKDTTTSQVQRMLRIPEPIYRELKERADQERRSVNKQVIVAIEQHLANGKGG